MDKDLLYVKEAVQNRVNFLKTVENKKNVSCELNALDWVLQIINVNIVVYDEETYLKMQESKDRCNLCHGILIRYLGKYNGIYESYAPVKRYGELFKEHLIYLKETDRCERDNEYRKKHRN